MAGLTPELAAYRDAALALVGAEAQRAEAEQAAARRADEQQRAAERDLAERRARVDAIAQRLASARQRAAGRRVSLPERVAANGGVSSSDPLALAEQLADRVDAAVQDIQHAADAMGRERKRLAEAHVTYREAIERQRREREAAEAAAAAARAKARRDRLRAALIALALSVVVGGALVAAGVVVAGVPVLVLGVAACVALLRWASADSS